MVSIYYIINTITMIMVCDDFIGWEVRITNFLNIIKKILFLLLYITYEVYIKSCDENFLKMK